MSPLVKNVNNREWLLNRLRAEVVGPDPACGEDVIETKEDENVSLTKEQFYHPKKQQNGDEILWQDAPIKRYGAGILFPGGVTEEEQLVDEAETAEEIQVAEEVSPGDYAINEVLEEKAEQKISKVKSQADDTENYDVSLANAYRPSAMGLSLLANLESMGDSVTVEVKFARYKKKNVVISDSGQPESNNKRTLWFRKLGHEPGDPGSQVVFSKNEILAAQQPLRKWVSGYVDKLQVVVVVRQLGGNNKHVRLITFSLVNRQDSGSRGIDEQCYFQCGLTVKSEEHLPWILPYPEVLREKRKPGDEEEIVRLLYRDRRTFAIGHGCATDWPGERPDRVSEVWTEVLPTFETPATSADLKDEHGNPLRVSMRKLAMLDPDDDGRNDLNKLIASYEKWIDSLEDFDHRKTLDGRPLPVPDDLKSTARILIERCRECLDRIKKGVEFLQSDLPQAENAREAFRLANHAMLIAQLRTSRVVRNPVWGGGRLTWDKDIYNPDPSIPHPDKGYWRAFQITFVLMSLRGICLPDDPDDERKLVDLIWFPTGGGKTEAYLGLVAFTVFYNRLSGYELGGADVIMRYTLRLLTAQQFQRAGLLFCAMEHLRKQNSNREKLGEKEFRIGMWVGGDASPNKREHARAALRRLKKDPDTENPFVILKCPWCNARFGPDKKSAGRRGGARGGGAGHKDIYGYALWPSSGSNQTVAFRCDDSKCEFGHSPIQPNRPPLPISIIDEDIIDNPPSLVIGTVDKFAMLAWKPETRAIFGINDQGEHTGLPPTLIIQDELHLISGPLGSMVGMYETVIEELCSGRNPSGSVVLPKIVASTATISRAGEQVKSLYARERVMLFPPSGLEDGDSFFSREARDESGKLLPGRLYTGVMAPGYGSQQTTIARVFATLLQYPLLMPVEEGDESARDPWWTLLSFFNSLRELGGTATLLVADARDYLRVILTRHGYSYKDIRQLLNVVELTSRIRGDHIPLAIQQLEIPYQRNSDGRYNNSVEVCLASNIIEVGVDIERLSLMTIVGQPKTTSQYIQVSSRVGRSMLAPGMVVVLLSQSKPRDRSHYETFRPYHQRLYAQVEPTSVTPFSPPAVDRALHGIILAAARQLSSVVIGKNPRPFPLKTGSDLRNRIEDMIERRVTVVDVAERANVRKIMLRRLKEWEIWNPVDYGGFGAPPDDPPLMHPAGSRQPVSWNSHSWATLSSLRNVDATCEAEITTWFNELEEED